MAYNNVSEWYNSFLNRAPSADELSHWQNIAGQDPNGAFDQFLTAAQQERPLDSLTDHQRKVYGDVVNAIKSPSSDAILNNVLGGQNPTSYDQIKDALYDNITDLDNNRSAFDAKWKGIWDSGGKDALAKALQDQSSMTALLEMQAANRKPNGSDDSFMSFLKEGLPIAALPFAAGMGLQALGVGAAGAGGATAATSGLGTAGAAAGAGGAATGAGGLSSMWASLPGAAQSALTSMGVQGGVNVLTGKPLTRGLLQAGLMSGLGSLGAGFIGPSVGEGLSSLGFSPETVSSLVKPVTTGIIGTGSGLIRGQSLGNALLNGMQSGTISYAGDKLNGFLSDQGFNKPTTDILGGASKGAMSSIIKGKNPLAGLVSGATSGAFNYGAGLLNPSSPEISSPSKVNMSGESSDDDFSLDGNDWLSKIENDYSDPYGFRNTNFTNYGDNNYEPYTMNDSYADAYPDMTSYEAPDTGNPALDSFLKQLGGGVGGALGNAVAGGGSSSNSFLDKLMKQLGGVGDKASQNPLAAIAAALGAAGTVRNAFGGAPNNLGAVDALMAKGAQQMNTPAILPRGNVVARDPRLFMQNYDASGAPTAQPAPAGPDYHNQLSTLYQSVLGRAPDAAGEQYWQAQMQKGMPLQDVLRALQQSPEHSPNANAVMTGALSKVQP